MTELIVGLPGEGLTPHQASLLTTLLIDFFDKLGVRPITTRFEPPIVPRGWDVIDTSHD